MMKNHTAMKTSIGTHGDKSSFMRLLCLNGCSHAVLPHHHLSRSPSLLETRPLLDQLLHVLRASIPAYRIVSEADHPPLRSQRGDIGVASAGTVGIETLSSNHPDLASSVAQRHRRSPRPL